MTGLRELGYIEGQSIKIEYRSAQGGENDSLKSPTKWFVQAGSDVAASNATTHAA